MVDAKREEHIAKMHEVYEQMQNAGPVHKRDLKRQLNRMRKELCDYDRFRKKAVMLDG